MLAGMIGGIVFGTTGAAVALLSGAGVGSALLLYIGIGMAAMVAISLVPLLMCAAQRWRAPRDTGRLNAGPSSF